MVIKSCTCHRTALGPLGQRLPPRTYIADPSFLFVVLECIYAFLINYIQIYPTPAFPSAHHLIPRPPSPDPLPCLTNCFLFFGHSYPPTNSTTNNKTASLESCRRHSLTGQVAQAQLARKSQPARVDIGLRSVLCRTASGASGVHGSGRRAKRGRVVGGGGRGSRSGRGLTDAAQVEGGLEGAGCGRGSGGRGGCGSYGWRDVLATGNNVCLIIWLK